MSRTLIDTNLLVRISDPKDKQYHEAVSALNLLSLQGIELRMVPQTLYEYWVVGTRPREQNGLGFAPKQLRRLYR